MDLIPAQTKRKAKRRGAEDIGLRVAAAVRDLRRTLHSGALRSRAYGEISDLRQMDTLDVLAEWVELRIGELAIALRVDNSTATRAVQQLESRGLVFRQGDGLDARAVVVRLTAEGEARHREVCAKRKVLMRTLLRDFSAAEQSTLIDLVTRLVTAMDREAFQVQRRGSERAAAANLRGRSA
jgi:DNA-binding MarR family transcriptional regulator